MSTLTHAWPTEQEIGAQHSAGADRRWSCFDLSECRHALRTGGDVGAWFVEVCESCGLVTAVCTHLRSEWNEAGTLLRCLTCGIDGT